MIKGLNKLPTSPGVYFFKRGRDILYIGKATSLRERVRSYFSTGLGVSRGPLIEKMIALATSVDCRITDSVLEALILESQLIKRHQPPYNAREKDDKSFWFVAITKEDWPRILAIRGHQLRSRANFHRFTLKGSDADENLLPTPALFGPFPHGAELRAALKIIRKIFPFRDRCVPMSGRACFSAQIGLCPGVCAGTISQTAYRAQVKRIKQLFSGRKQGVIVGLKRAMRAAAAAQDFAAAARYRDQIFALRHIADVAMIKEPSAPLGAEGVFRIEAFDVAHSLGQAAVGAVALVVGGEPEPSGFRLFRLKRATSQTGADSASLNEILERRLAHEEWPLPDLLAVDGGLAQINVARRALSRHGLTLPVVGVVKDERHRPARLEGAALRRQYEREILLANRLAHNLAIRYHRRRRRLEL